MKIGHHSWVSVRKVNGVVAAVAALAIPCAVTQMLRAAPLQAAAVLLAVHHAAVVANVAPCHHGLFGLKAV